MPQEVYVGGQKAKNPKRQGRAQSVKARLDEMMAA